MLSATAAPNSAETLPARVRDIATLRGLGYSFREIGASRGISAQAVSLMLSRHRRSIKSLGSAVELRELSTRAINVLGRHGITSREQAISRNVLELLRNERNCGSKTQDEVMRWLVGNPANAKVA
jgi:hypothetical protein